MNFGDDPREYKNLNSVARIRKSLQLKNGDESEHLKAVKDDTKDIVALGISHFKDKMEAGQVEIDNVADLERLVKLGLLVEGSATEITQDNSQSAVIEISDEAFGELSETEEFAAIRDRIAGDLNAKNSEEL